MKKLYRTRNNNALSTVLSTVLMIMVVMIGMTLLFAYIAVYSESFQDGSGSAVLESLTIEDVHFIDSKNVDIWVYNTGKVTFDVNGVYINGLIATVTQSSSVGNSVDPGDHLYLKVTSPSDVYFSTSSFYSYNFKFVTTRGTITEGTYIW